VFCYEDHEELLHNPVLLPGDLEKFSELVRMRRLSERRKTANRRKMRGRVVLLHDVLRAGLAALLARERRGQAPSRRP
jgi:hypothetical protein